MNLVECIRGFARQQQELPTWRVLYVCTAEYPALFLSRFLPFIARAYGLPLVVTPVTDDTRAWQGRFTTSFLGTRQVHWCSENAETGSSRARAGVARQLREFLVAYTGPHVLVAWDGGLVRVADQGTHLVINQGGCIDQEIWDLLCSCGLFTIDPAIGKRALASLYSSSLTLERACQILHYAEIAGNASGELWTDWRERFGGAQQSLFPLSQEFFAKRPRAIALWREICETYPPEFWTAYWSEQLWQAAHYVTVAQQGPIADPKRIANRLPHAFLNGGWRRYTVRELSAAHNFLYGVDFASKNSGGDYGLEIMRRDYNKLRQASITREITDLIGGLL